MKITTKAQKARRNEVVSFANVYHIVPRYGSRRLCGQSRGKLVVEAKSVGMFERKYLCQKCLGSHKGPAPLP